MEKGKNKFDRAYKVVNKSDYCDMVEREAMPWKIPSIRVNRAKAGTVH